MSLPVSNKSFGVNQIWLKSKAEYIGYAEGSVKDTIIVKFKLCHANKNNNNDEFTKKELVDNYKTAEGKAYCYGHNKTYNIGFIQKSVYVDVEESKAYVNVSEGERIDEDVDLSAYGHKEGEDSYIYCEAVVWSARYPDEAEEIRSDFEDGQLYVSMETYFEKCKCGACGHIAQSENEYCECLENRFKTGTSRILMGCTFAGVAKVSNPADKDAIGLAAAEGFSLIDLIPEDKFNLSALVKLTLES